MDNIRNVTRESAPFHIWREHVTTLAAVAGVDPEFTRTESIRGRLLRAYQAGEPAWMMADELKFRARRTAIENRADAEAAGLRRRLAGVR